MPPPLATMKMKKTTRWRVRARLALARRSGRISSAEAPVVPITLASRRPTARKRGVDERRARQRPAQADAARDHEQRAEERHEGQVLARRSRQSSRAAVGWQRNEVDDHRSAGGERERELVAVVLPEAARGTAAGRRSAGGRRRTAGPPRRACGRRRSRRRRVTWRARPWPRRAAPWLPRSRRRGPAPGATGGEELRIAGHAHLRHVEAGDLDLGRDAVADELADDPEGEAADRRRSSRCRRRPR